MDNSFSLYRVGLLIKRQWASFGKIFLIALGAVTLIIIGSYYYLLPTANQENLIVGYETNANNRIILNFPYVVFMIVGSLFISLSSNYYFSKCGKKANAIEELLLPASNVEKTIASMALTSIVVIGSFLVFFLLIDGIARVYLNAYLQHKLIRVADYGDQQQLIKPFTGHVDSFIKTIGNKMFLLVILAGFLIQSAFLLGSIYFKRFQYIKTLVTFLLTGFVSIVLGFKWYVRFTKGKVEVYHTLQELDHKNGGFPDFFFIVLPLLILVFYWVTYLRVKEKEV